MNYSMEDIEKIELKYLNKYFYFLKFCEDEMFDGLKTKEYIISQWKGLYGRNKAGSGISEFAVGAERIVYALLNGKGIGQPNSAPVGSDLFFEVKDAYIHIDMKTVNIENLGDFSTSIPIGINQNSYEGTIQKSGKKKSELYSPSLPTIYNKNINNTIEQKICLTYFITILYNDKDDSIKVISIDSMPNGKLYSHYKDRPLKAGKNHGKARFNISDVNKFELLKETPSRIKVVYYDKNMSSDLDSKLSLYK